jgi:hypothetical protein
VVGDASFPFQLPEYNAEWLQDLLDKMHNRDAPIHCRSQVTYFYSSGDPHEFGKPRKARDASTYICIMVTRNTRKQEDVQLPGGLLASFPCKMNTFRERVTNVVTSKGIKVGTECE